MPNYGSFGKSGSECRLHSTGGEREFARCFWLRRSIWKCFFFKYKVISLYRGLLQEIRQALGAGRGRSRLRRVSRQCLRNQDQSYPHSGLLTWVKRLLKFSMHAIVFYFCVSLPLMTRGPCGQNLFLIVLTLSIVVFMW